MERTVCSSLCVALGQAVNDTPCRVSGQITTDGQTGTGRKPPMEKAHSFTTINQLLFETPAVTPFHMQFMTMAHSPHRGECVGF